MTNIEIYENDARTLEKICSLNDMRVAELIECLMDFLPDVIEENTLQGGELL